MDPQGFLNNYVEGFKIPLGSGSPSFFDPKLQEGYGSFDDYIKWQLDNQLPGPDRSVPGSAPMPPPIDKLGPPVPTGFIG